MPQGMLGLVDIPCTLTEPSHVLISGEDYVIDNDSVDRMYFFTFHKKASPVLVSSHAKLATICKSIPEVVQF